MTLTQAIQKIETKYQRRVMMIEFEDGSGFKFNVRFYGDKNITFVNLELERIHAEKLNSIYNKMK